jgi:hypothetical protein
VKILPKFISRNQPGRWRKKVKILIMKIGNPCDILNLVNSGISYG